jgi:hemoglobin
MRQFVPTTRLWLVVVVTVALSGGVGAALAQHGKDAPTTKPAAPAETLYKRLGGYDAIAAVVDDFIGRMVADPSLSKFFAGHSDASKKRIRQLVVDQLCQATGGPCYYIGVSMKDSHAGLGISEADWTNAVNHLVATFDKFKVPQRERDEVLGALSALKPDIVTVK